MKMVGGHCTVRCSCCGSESAYSGRGGGPHAGAVCGAGGGARAKSRRATGGRLRAALRAAGGNSGAARRAGTARCCCAICGARKNIARPAISLPGGTRQLTPVRHCSCQRTCQTPPYRAPDSAPPSRGNARGAWHRSTRPPRASCPAAARVWARGSAADPCTCTVRQAGFLAPAALCRSTHCRSPAVTNRFTFSDPPRGSSPRRQPDAVRRGRHLFSPGPAVTAPPPSPPLRSNGPFARRKASFPDQFASIMSVCLPRLGNAVLLNTWRICSRHEAHVSSRCVSMAHPRQGPDAHCSAVASAAAASPPSNRSVRASKSTQRRLAIAPRDTVSARPVARAAPALGSLLRDRGAGSNAPFTSCRLVFGQSPPLPRARLAERCIAPSPRCCAPAAASTAEPGLRNPKGCRVCARQPAGRLSVGPRRCARVLSLATPGRRTHPGARRLRKRPRPGVSRAPRQRFASVFAANMLQLGNPPVQKYLGVL